MADDLHLEELQVLQAIYPDCLFGDSDGYKLCIPIEISSQEVYIGETMSAQLAHLPPLILDFILPQSYPKSRRPELNFIRSTYDWLAEKQLQSLRSHLSDMWSGEGVLYSWMEYIRTGDLFVDLGMILNGKLRCVISIEPGCMIHIFTHQDTSPKSS